MQPHPHLGFSLATPRSYVTRHMYCFKPFHMGSHITVAREDYYNLGVCSAPMREVLSFSCELRLQILQWASIVKLLPALESRLMNKKHQFPLSNYTKSFWHTKLRLKK